MVKGAHPALSAHIAGHLPGTPNRSARFGHCGLETPAPEPQPSPSACFPVCLASEFSGHLTRFMMATKGLWVALVALVALRSALNMDVGQTLSG